MNDITYRLASRAWAAVSGRSEPPAEARFVASGALPSVFPVTDLASAAIAAAGLALVDLIREIGGQAPALVVDRRMSSIWFRGSIQPIGWTVPPPWDPIAGDYRTRDGWIRLHTNAPRHRAAALRVLDAEVEADKEAVARRVSEWTGAELEAAIVANGGCAAEMRSIEAWRRHPQGVAVAAEPLAHLSKQTSSAKPVWRLKADRPLAGLRVLDLTRVLAGPVATRFLAGYGAEVLRLDPPDWNEPSLAPDVTLGKRCARLDLKRADGRAAFEALLSQSDILVHGYRPGALEALDYDADRRAALAPGLIEASLDAYGWRGPWADRRGFDSLVQMSTGIADAGMRDADAAKPTPLPVQALDHATGYLMAAAAICGVAERLRQGGGAVARLSLARTATLLIEHQTANDQTAFAGGDDADWSAEIERTEWGDARRAKSPLSVAGAPMRWDFPASSLGSAPASWRAGC